MSNGRWPDVLGSGAILCFFDFFHLGELLSSDASSPTHLSWGDMTFVDASEPSMINVHLHMSKCNQGASMFVGKTDNVLYLPSLPNSPGHNGPRRLLYEVELLTIANTHLHIGAAKGVGNPWTTSSGIRRSHHPHQCSYGHCSSRRGGLDYLTDGKMEQCSLPGIHQNTRLSIFSNHLMDCMTDS